MFNFIIFIFYFFIFFPYIEFYDFGSDTQPYALILSILITFLYLYKYKKINMKLLLLLIVTLISTTFILFDGLNKTVLRSLANYYSLFFITFATYITLKINNRIFNDLFLKVIINTWLVVGLSQRFLNVELFYNIIARHSTTPGRGVVSLAPEPTFYGIICIFLLIIVFEKLEGRSRYLYAFNCIFQILFLAKSSMVIIFLFILIFYFLLFSLLVNTNIKNLFIYFLLTSFSFVSFNIIVRNFLNKTRIYELYMLFLQDPLSIFLKDASANDRFAHIFFSIKGFLTNYLLPHGFLEWSSYLVEQVPKNDWFFWVSFGSRIMSGYGAAFFELGFIGLLIPISITIVLINYNTSLKNKLIYFGFFHTILFSAIPLAHPYLNFIMGYFLYYGHSKKRKEGRLNA